MRFHTTIQRTGKTATGIEIPREVIEELGAGKRPPVRVTIGDYTYRSTVASRSGRFLVGVNAENRAGAGVEGGDEVDAEIELDTESREVGVPRDLAEALAGDKEAKSFFQSLTPTQRKYFVKNIEDAKQAETRERRIAKTIEKLRAGKKA